MLQPDNTALLELYYRDREREARITLRFPFALSGEEISSAAQELQSAIAGISDARLVRREIKWRWHDASPQPASGPAPANSHLVLFYRNEADYDALFLPAPKAELWEAAGPYAGVRLDTNNPFVQSAMGDFNLALASAVGAVFPFVGSTFVVGGLAL
jgi:hypothetical protein